MVAVEIDARLADRLPEPLANSTRRPSIDSLLSTPMPWRCVSCGVRRRCRGESLNVSVPVVLHLLAGSTAFTESGDGAA